MKSMQRSAFVTLLVVLLYSHSGSAFAPSRPSSTSFHQAITFGADSDATTIATIKTLNEATINSSLKKRSRVFSRLALKSFSRDASSTTSTTLFQSSTNSDRSGPTRIIIAGAPASGKGTQCELIKERFGVVHLSTGDMLRAAVAAGTPVGVEAQSYMDSGRLVPDSTMIGVVKARLNEADCQSQGWLLDGFPRTRAQADALAEAGIIADCFIFLNVPDEVLVERVVGRRTDPETGKIYHLTFSPPPADDTALLGRLQHRSDDTEDKIKVRLEQFRQNVEAVKGSYENISVTIDGNQPPSVVSNLIFAAIDSLVPAA